MKEPGGRVICVVGGTGIGVGDDVGATETGGLVWEFPFVPPTANPAGDSAAAVVLVVSVPLATETPERLGSVGAQVKQAPVPQVYVRR